MIALFIKNVVINEHLIKIIMYKTHPRQVEERLECYRTLF